jgi:hypothetical protein
MQISDQARRTFDQSRECAINAALTSIMARSSSAIYDENHDITSVPVLFSGSVHAF